jgi:hypothetical protein
MEDRWFKLLCGLWGISWFLMLRVNLILCFIIVYFGGFALLIFIDYLFPIKGSQRALKEDTKNDIGEQWL